MTRCTASSSSKRRGTQTRECAASSVQPVIDQLFCFHMNSPRFTGILVFFVCFRMCLDRFAPDRPATHSCCGVAALFAVFWLQ